MQKLYSTTRDTLRDILLGDDQLRLRTFIQPTNTLDQYRHNFVELLNEALRLRSWYCTRYLLGVTNLDYYNTRVKAELLWSAIASGDPEMLEMAYTTEDTLDHVGIGGKSACVHLAAIADTGMAQALANNWDGNWRSIDWRSILMHTMYSRNATIQVLIPMPRVERMVLCEQVLKQLRRNSTDGFIVQSAIEANDWMLLTYMETFEKPALKSALECLDWNSPVPWVLHRAAAENAGNAIEVIKAMIDVNCVDDYGNTMLHIASRCGNITTVEKLLQAGADPRLRNRDGYTVLGYMIGSASPSLRCAALIASKLTEEERSNIPHESWYNRANESMHQMLYNPERFEIESQK